MEAKLTELDTIITGWVQEVVHDFVKTLEPAIGTKVKLAWDAYSGNNIAILPAVVSNTQVGQCPYLFKKGKKIGQICNTLVKEGGGQFCAKHRIIPQISTKVFELDLSRVEDETEEEIYLSPCEEKEIEEDMDDVEEEMEEEPEDDDDEPEDNDDDLGDGDDDDEEEF